MTTPNDDAATRAALAIVSQRRGGVNAIAEIIRAELARQPATVTQPDAGADVRAAAEAAGKEIEDRFDRTSTDAGVIIARHMRAMLAARDARVRERVDKALTPPPGSKWVIGVGGGLRRLGSIPTPATDYDREAECTILVVDAARQTALAALDG